MLYLLAFPSGKVFFAPLEKLSPAKFVLANSEGVPTTVDISGEEEEEAVGPTFVFPAEKPKEVPDLSEAEIYLNNGASYTKDLTLEVTLKKVKKATRMRVSSTSEFRDIRWQDLKEKFLFEIAPGDGRKTVYVQFQSKDGVIGKDILSESIVLDTIPPAAPVNFQGEAEDSHIYLSWLPPSDPDFAGVRILKSEKDFVLEPVTNEGILFEGRAEGAFDFEAERGKTYFFSIFAFDYARNYSNPGLLEIKVPSLVPEEKPEVPEEKPEMPEKKPRPPKEKPGVPEKPKPPTEEPELPVPPKPVEPALKKEVKQFNFAFQAKTLTLKMGSPSEAQPLEERKFHYLERTPLTVILDERDFPKKPKKVQLLLGNILKYGFKPQSPEWEVKFEIPPIALEQTFTLSLQVFYEDGTKDEIILGKVLVDPFGYVFKTVFEPHLQLFRDGFWSWQKKERRERIPEAIVALYVLRDDIGGSRQGSDKEWQLWPGRDYEQKNPQTTTKEGEYGFMVERGTYFLEVSKPGFGKKTTSPFKVEETIVNKNIELAAVTIDWWRVGDNLLKIITLSLLFIIYIMIMWLIFKKERERRKRKERQLNPF